MLLRSRKDSSNHLVHLKYGDIHSDDDSLLPIVESLLVIKFISQSICERTLPRFVKSFHPFQWQIFIFSCIDKIFERYQKTFTNMNWLKNTLQSLIIDWRNKDNSYKCFFCIRLTGVSENFQQYYFQGKYLRRIIDIAFAVFHFRFEGWLVLPCCDGKWNLFLLREFDISYEICLLHFQECGFDIQD